jgi:hypothetical protein
VRHPGPSLALECALALAGALLVLGIGATPARAQVDVWLTDPGGKRFRVRFDPGSRAFIGGGAATAVGGGAPSLVPALEVGLLSRFERPAAGWDVSWSRSQALGLLRLSPASSGRVVLDGALYRGLFLRASREGTLTIPSSTPLVVPLPFDIGVRIDVLEARGLAVGSGWPTGTLGVFHGAALGDFLRAHVPGRFVALGLGGRYEVAFAGDAAGPRTADHLIAPLTALSLAARAERADGLLVAGARAEGAWRWSSRRGWEPHARAEAELEVTALAINDRPLSFLAWASAEAGASVAAGEGTARAGSPVEVRGLVGLRFSQPLR